MQVGSFFSACSGPFFGTLELCGFGDWIVDCIVEKVEESCSQVPWSMIRMCYSMSDYYWTWFLFMEKCRTLKKCCWQIDQSSRFATGYYLVNQFFKSSNKFLYFEQIKYTNSAEIFEVLLMNIGWFFSKRRMAKTRNNILVDLDDGSSKTLHLA